MAFEGFIQDQSFSNGSDQNQRKIQYQIGECVAHNLREFTARQDAGVIPEAYIFHGIHGHQKIIIHQAEYG